MKVRQLFFLIIFLQCACTPKDDFEQVRKTLIRSEHLLKGSMYCLNEQNFAKAKQKVEKVILKDSDELNEYFKMNGIKKKSMISEVIVRSLCDIKTYYHDKDIQSLTNNQFKGSIEESINQVIRKSLNIRSYSDDGTPIKDRRPTIN